MIVKDKFFEFSGETKNFREGHKAAFKPGDKRSLDGMVIFHNDLNPGLYLPP